MTIQTASSAATPKQRTTRFVTAAAGAVLALTAAAGLGAWQASHQGGTSVAEPQAAAMAAPAPVRPATSRATDATSTYYLVASQAQAATVHAALEEANAVRATSGEPTRALHVELLESAEAEAAFLTAMSSLDAIRGTFGQPPVRVIDLRPVGEAAARVPALVPATFSDQELYQRWVQAQAAHPAGAQ